MSALGSFASHRYAGDARGMSASHPKATGSMCHKKLSRCAKSGLMHRSTKQPQRACLIDRPVTTLPDRWDWKKSSFAHSTSHLLTAAPFENIGALVPTVKQRPIDGTTVCALRCQPNRASQQVRFWRGNQQQAQGAFGMRTTILSLTAATCCSEANYLAIELSLTRKW
jgi:hypothetical protein